MILGKVLASGKAVSESGSEAGNESKRARIGSALWPRRRGRDEQGVREGYYTTLQNCSQGDVVLYYTKQYGAKLQRLVTRSRFDHIGILVIWEKCSDDCCPAALKESRKSAGIKAWHTLEADATGVTLYRFTPALIKAYNGTCCIRHLKFDDKVVNDCTRKKMEQDLHSFIEEMYGRPYEKHALEMIKAANMFGGNKKEDLSSVFCSELVAAAYRRMGILSEGRTCNSYIPGDFASTAKTKRRIKLVNGAHLEDEIYIDPENLFLSSDEAPKSADLFDAFGTSDKMEASLSEIRSRQQLHTVKVDRILHEVEGLSDNKASGPIVRYDNSTQLLRQAKLNREGSTQT
mmetsp:Transcript_4208/g.5618  ORF Transcript_4208/g.5618 Transcript_4208/m.5618 type:complete len:346 (+) Transcript_4208:200-1237(+)